MLGFVQKLVFALWLIYSWYFSDHNILSRVGRRKREEGRTT